MADLPARFELPVRYHGLTAAQRRRVREQYIAEQNGLCKYCKASLGGLPADYVELVWIDKDIFPPGFFKNPVHLHHNHKTGMTIGALHAKCNAVLFQHFGR